MTNTADLLAGPEYSHLYKTGMETKKRNLSLVKVRGMLPGNDEATQVSQIMTGPRSKTADRVLKWADRFAVDKNTAQSGKSKWAGRIAGAATAAGAAMVEPVLPLVNGARTALANSKLGQRILKNRAIAGMSGKRVSGISQKARDLIVSPSLSIAQNAAYHSLRPK